MTMVEIWFLKAGTISLAPTSDVMCVLKILNTMFNECLNLSISFHLIGSPKRECEVLASGNGAPAPPLTGCVVLATLVDV